MHISDTQHCFSASDQSSTSDNRINFLGGSFVFPLNDARLSCNLQALRGKEKGRGGMVEGRKCAFITQGNIKKEGEKKNQ